MSNLNTFTTSFSTKIINKIRNVSVFKRLIIFFLMLIILPTSAITIVTYNTYTKEITKNISDLLSYTNRNIAQSISQQMNYYENLIQNVYSNEELMQMVMELRLYDPTQPTPDYLALKRSIEHILYTYTNNNDSYILNLQIVTPTDQFSQTSFSSQKKGGYLLDLNDFIHSNYYSEAISFKGHPVWFDTSIEDDLFYRQTDPSRPIVESLTLMKSIPNYHLQDSMGVIVLNVYFKSLVSNVDSSLLNSSGNMLLISPLGTILSINSNVKGPIPKDIPLLYQDIGNSLQGTLFTTIDGQTCLGAYEKLSNSDLYVLNVAFYETLIKNANNIKNLTLFTMALVIIIAIIIAYFVTLSITMPLNRLQSVMQELPYENLKISFSDTSQDEISILGQHFNNMICQIQELINKVYLSEIYSKDLAFKKKQAELNALQMQINPHFLYNTLDIIRWEIVNLEEDDHKVSQMIDSFSSFLRLSIKKTSELVPIAEEIDHLHSYLEVINYRYTSKIHLDILLEPSIQSLLIPKLTLQPLVENCVLHAFNSKSPNKNITLQAKLSENFFILYVIDNGIGMPEKTQKAINNSLDALQATSSKGIGLYNVHERIGLYFGKEYGLSVTSTGPQGTTLAIKLPLTYSNRTGDSYV